MTTRPSRRQLRRHARQLRRDGFQPMMLLNSGDRLPGHHAASSAAGRHRLAGRLASRAQGSPPSRAWSAWATQVAKHRVLTAAVALAVLIVAALPVFGIKLGETSASAFAKSGPARTSYDTLAAGGVPSGALTPIEVLSTAKARPATAGDLNCVCADSARELVTPEEWAMSYGTCEVSTD
jgi:hypothetical protein